MCDLLDNCRNLLNDVLILLGQLFFNFSVYQDRLQGLLNTDFWAHPTVSNSVGLGWGQQFAFLTCAPEMLMVLVQEPHFENNCPKQIS